MANNRMAIVCKDCNKGVSIAKYYPQKKGDPLFDDGSGWGQYPLNKDKVNEFFARHQHDYDTSMWGGNQYELRYEIDDNTWTYEMFPDNLDAFGSPAGFKIPEHEHVILTGDSKQLFNQEHEKPV